MLFITLGLVPMAFMDGFVAFLLWIFTTVMSPGNYLFGFMLSFRFVFVFAGIAVLLLMLGRVKDRGKFQWNAGTVLLFLFVVHGMLSAAFALQPNLLLEIRVETFLKGMALALMAPFFLSSRWRIHLTLVVLGLGLGLHGVIDGLKVIASGGAHNVAGVPNSALTDNNLYALGMAMLVPLLMYLYRYSSNRYAKWAATAGVVLTIMTIIGTLLTALVVAREWERGTMEGIFSTPATVLEILLGKLLPYFCLGLIAVSVSAVLAVWVFGVPLRGSVLTLLLLSSVFLIPALGQGLLISTLARNQFVAAQIALLSGFLPAFILSGFLFEIRSMPRIIQIVTYLVPARYYNAGLQTVFLAGDVWPLILPSIGAMLLLGSILFAIVVRKTRKSLEV